MKKNIIIERYNLISYFNWTDVINIYRLQFNFVVEGEKMHNRNVYIFAAFFYKVSSWIKTIITI